MTGQKKQMQKKRIDEACRFIHDHQLAEGISPTVSKIGGCFYLTLTSSAWANIQLLTDNGKVTLKRGRPRTICLTEDPE